MTYLEAEGGCGVVGFASTTKLAGKHLHVPCVQMHNRGNGKGGGVVAVGLSPEQMGVSPEVLESHYLVQIAYLRPEIREELEAEFILAKFEVAHDREIETRTDHAEIGLEVRPPDVHRYFCRVKPGVLKAFEQTSGLSGQKAEDEFVFQNTFALNQKYYASLGEQQAFVLSHGKNMMLFKIVGYAEQAIEYYGLDENVANIWVGHQRYPTKGVVWHPGGAHPFIGMNDALVHNGDFANYHAVCEYLKQHDRSVQFLTDTEVSILLFDLWSRRHEYPLEYVIEALAPTSERDFLILPGEKQDIYRTIQATHMHCSPDGPWFFIIARNLVQEGAIQLLGITDTSMLRPQVFALQENPEASIGLIASEKQAIDSILESISSDDDRFVSVADQYWNARGGSYTDGGAFSFTIKDGRLSCANKFGAEVKVQRGERSSGQAPAASLLLDREEAKAYLAACFIDDLKSYLDMLLSEAQQSDKQMQEVIALLTGLIDRRYALGGKRRSEVLVLLHDCLYQIFRAIPDTSQLYALLASPKARMPEPGRGAQTLVIAGRDFEPEGKDNSASLIVEAYEQGWRNFIIYDMHGQRFAGCGFGNNSEKVRIDLYGSSGDYAGSGLYDVEVHIHGNGQDQLGQILKSGKLVVYGDVGQTFMYGAKGGESYVMGNTAGRALINAVGRPRVVINGTCLDYLAESFMAGDPHQGGGFVVLNGMSFDVDGELVEQPAPYPGGNLFSLASGGAVYIRDPHQKVGADQLNGGRFESLSQADWELIKPYLEENERLFGIGMEQLLTVDGQPQEPGQVYRKVTVGQTEALA